MNKRELEIKMKNWVLDSSCKKVDLAEGIALIMLWLIIDEGIKNNTNDCKHVWSTEIDDERSYLGVVCIRCGKSK